MRRRVKERMKEDKGAKRALLCLVKAIATCYNVRLCRRPSLIEAWQHAQNRRVCWALHCFLSLCFGQSCC